MQVMFTAESLTVSKTASNVRSPHGEMGGPLWSIYGAEPYSTLTVHEQNPFGSASSELKNKAKHEKNQAAR